MPKLGIHGTACSNCIRDEEASNEAMSDKDKINVASVIMSVCTRIPLKFSFLKSKSRRAPAAGRKVTMVKK